MSIFFFFLVQKRMYVNFIFIFNYLRFEFDFFFNQGNLVLKDFNIMDEAKGAGIGIIKEFDVSVEGSALEIHLYWAGKGTSAIPDRSVYGPLISAISVKASKFFS